MHNDHAAFSGCSMRQLEIPQRCRKHGLDRLRFLNIGYQLLGESRHLSNHTFVCACRSFYLVAVFIIIIVIVIIITVIGVIKFSFNQNNWMTYPNQVYWQFLNVHVCLGGPALNRTKLSSFQIMSLKSKSVKKVEQNNKYPNTCHVPLVVRRQS